MERPATVNTVNQSLAPEYLATNQGVVGSNPAGRATAPRPQRELGPFPFAAALQRRHTFREGKGGFRPANNGRSCRHPRTQRRSNQLLGMYRCRDGTALKQT